jgi:hypothetical protein
MALPIRTCRSLGREQGGRGVQSGARGTHLKERGLANRNSVVLTGACRASVDVGGGQYPWG